MVYAQIFIYLQVLDFLTTMVGLKTGAGEFSPFIRWLMHLGPVAGVIASKGMALLLAAVCVWIRRTYLVKWISYWYAGLVVWNMCIILAAMPHC